MISKKKNQLEIVIKATSSDCKGRKRERAWASNNSIPKLLGLVPGPFGISHLVCLCLTDPNIIKRLVTSSSVLPAGLGPPCGIQAAEMPGQNSELAPPHLLLAPISPI